MSQVTPSKSKVPLPSYTNDQIRRSFPISIPFDKTARDTTRQCQAMLARRGFVVNQPPPPSPEEEERAYYEWIELQKLDENGAEVGAAENEDEPTAGNSVQDVGHHLHDGDELRLNLGGKLRLLWKKLGPIAEEADGIIVAARKEASLDNGEDAVVWLNGEVIGQMKDYVFDNYIGVGF